MKTYYNLIDKLYAYLNGNASINTVTFGDLLEVDLSKQTIFPLAHVGFILVNNVHYNYIEGCSHNVLLECNAAKPNVG